MLNNDNAESRELIESCYQRKKTVLNPIINWEDEDVWEFIKKYNVPYCELYDRGAKRLGCIGCPMNTTNAEELERYPTYKRAYIRAFEKMLEERKRKGLKSDWKTGDEVMKWWLEKKQKTDKNLEGQMEIEYEEN